MPVEAKIKDLQMQPLKGGGPLKIEVARMTMAGLETVDGRIKDHFLVAVTEEQDSEGFHNFLTQRVQIDPDKNLFVPGTARLNLVRPEDRDSKLVFSFDGQNEVTDPGQEADDLTRVIPVQVWEYRGVDIEGFDLDDTLFMREGITSFGGFLKGRVRSLSLPKYTLDTLPDLDHTPIDRPISGRREQIAFDCHRKRVAIPGVADRLKAKLDKGKRLIALSGRAATLDWCEMTIDQLRREGMPITEVVLTPDGVSTSVSKAHGIGILGVGEPDITYVSEGKESLTYSNYVSLWLT